jgi:hypothetical protein
MLPVSVARDRLGHTTDAVLAKPDRASVTTALSGVISPANQIYCDGRKAIVSIACKTTIPQPTGPMPYRGFGEKEGSHRLSKTQRR